jgi:hypothetical protein
VRVVFGEFYRDERIYTAAQEAGIELHHLPTVLPRRRASSSTICLQWPPTALREDSGVARSGWPT